MYSRTSLLLLIFVLSLPAAVCGESVHVLQKNETLYSIARKYDISLDELIRINNIKDVHKLNVGMEIIVSPETAAAHQVKKGETLFGIAGTYNVTLDELLAANNIERDYLLKVDDILKIPGTGNTELVQNEAVEEHAGAAAEEDRPEPEDRAETATLLQDLEEKDWPIIGVPVPVEGKLSGVYIKGNKGDPVRTISSGTVVWVGPYRGFGKVVLIQSFDRYVYVYGGNDHIEVEVGQEVKPGMVISKLGKNPHSQEPELFFSVFRNGKPVDPEKAPRS